MHRNPVFTRRALLTTISGTALLSGYLGQDYLLSQGSTQFRTQPCDSPSGSWPTTGGNTRRTHLAGADGSLPNQKAENERIELAHEDIASGGIASYPAIVDDTIFTTTKDGYALAQGGDNWTVELESTGTGTPSVTCGAVYLTDDAFTYALDRNSGDRIWKSDAASLTAPAVSNGTVFIGDFGSISAFNGRTGERLWRQSYSHSGTTYGIASTSEFVVTTVRSEGSGYVRCYTTNGSHQWSREVGPIFSMPAISGETTIIGGQDGTLRAIRTATGEEMWQTKIGREIETGFAVDEGTVFVPGGADGNVYAIDSTTGDIDWTQSVGISSAGPALVGDTLAVIGDEVPLNGDRSRSTGVAVLDSRTGEIDFAFDIPGADGSLIEASGSLAVGQGTLYYLFQGDIFKIE